MALAVLFELPETPEQWSTWAFVNMAHHRDINRKILQLGGPNLPESVLDPFNTEDPGAWLYKHWDMHQRQNAVLGIQGFDLVSVDWGDRDAMQGWIASHANEHVQAGTILNLG